MTIRFSLLLGLVWFAAPAAAQDPLTPAQEARVTPVVEVVRQAGPAVVNIFQEVVQEVEMPPPWNRLWGPQRRRSMSLGSGVIIDVDGFILTNAHVIQPHGQIQVQLNNGESHRAGLINIDTANDVALLKINAGRPLPVARLGTSSDVMVGETVIAIGNPLGNENTVTAGIVSSVYRNVRMPGSQRGPSFRDYIQIDAPINPGNSGGPLLNVLGEVIGINWAIATEAEGIGFAIPIDRARDSLVNKLMNPRELSDVVTGVELGSDAMGRNVRLAVVLPDSPAERAGLSAGDRVISVGGKPVEWLFDFHKALWGARPGEHLPLVVKRGDRTLPLEIELEAQASPMQFVLDAAGLRVVDHPRFFGVVVDAVDPRGPGAITGIQAGDLIDRVDEMKVDDTDDFFRALRSRPPGSEVGLHLFRGGVALRGALVLR